MGYYPMLHQARGASNPDNGLGVLWMLGCAAWSLNIDQAGWHVDEQGSRGKLEGRWNTSFERACTRRWCRPLGPLRNAWGNDELSKNGSCCLQWMRINRWRATLRLIACPNWKLMQNAWLETGDFVRAVCSLTNPSWLASFVKIWRSFQAYKTQNKK